MRSIVYVAHKLSAPTAAGMEENRRHGALWCAWLCRHFDVATVADWIVMSSVLDETHENRMLGLECDLTLIPVCSVVVLTGTVISGGMRQEADCGIQWAKFIADLTTLGLAVPTEDEALIEAVAGILRPFGIRRSRLRA